MKNFFLTASLAGLFFVPTLVAGCSSDVDGNPSGTGSSAATSGGNAALGSGGSTGSGGVQTASGGSDQASGGSQPLGTGGEGTASGGSNNSGGGDASGGGDGSGGSSGGSVEKSAGCGMATQQAAAMWVSSKVSSGGMERSYDVRLPQGYDPMTPYPVILLLHGCGSPTNNVPMEQVAGDAAIIVRGTGSSDGCWQETASGADLPYLDALMVDVQTRFCANPDHLFAVGYSSGSWLASTLSCHRGDMYRGIATVTGGEPSEQTGCMGQAGRIFIHDADDMNNKIEWDTPGRDRMLKTNHCSNDTMPFDTMPFDPSPCVEYQGCDPGYPVVWCQTSGKGHDRQDTLAKPAFWNFFQELMMP